MIRIKDVTKLYPAQAASSADRHTNSNGDIRALDHISLDVAPGEATLYPLGG